MVKKVGGNEQRVNQNIKAQNVQQKQSKAAPKNNGVFGDNHSRQVLKYSKAYIVVKGGKQYYYNAKNERIDQKEALRLEHEAMNKAKTQNIKTKVKQDAKAYKGLTHFKISGSKTGRYYVIGKDGQRHFFAANGVEVQGKYWLEKENARIAKNGQLARKVTAKETLEAVGSGVKKFFTRMWSDDKGNFSWSQLGKTALVIGAGALAVATFGTAAVVGMAVVGVAMGAKEVYDGVDKIKNGNSSAEVLNGVSETTTGGIDVGLSVAGFKAPKTSGSFGSGYKLGYSSARMAGKSKIAAFNSGLKEGTISTGKQLGNMAKGSAKTVKDVVIHPVRTAKNIGNGIKNKAGDFVESRRVKSQIKGATKEKLAEIKQEVSNNDKLTPAAKAKLTTKIDKAQNKAPDADLVGLKNKAERAEAKTKSTPSEHATRVYGKAKSNFDSAVDNSSSIENLEALKSKYPEGDPMRTTIDNKIATLKDKALSDFKAKVQSEKNIAKGSEHDGETGLFSKLRGKSKREKLIEEAKKTFKDDEVRFNEAKDYMNDKFE